MFRFVLMALGGVVGAAAGMHIVGELLPTEEQRRERREVRHRMLRAAEDAICDELRELEAEERAELRKAAERAKECGDKLRAEDAAAPAPVAVAQFPKPAPV